MILAWMQLVGGLVLLIVAGEFLVKSAVKLSLYLKISPLVIGLTVVSFGTSFPELVVSVNAALGGHPDIAMGNVVGSNIANLALVLGVTSLLFPMVIQRSTVVVEWPLMVIVTLILIAFAYDGVIARWEGGVLLFGLLAYNFLVIRNSRKNPSDEVDADFKRSDADMIRTMLILGVSIAALVFGADILVKGAVEIARDFGVEERIIAVTIVAFGTSAPELAASLVAVYRKEEALSIGNLIGSNIFNILGIVGATSLIKQISVNSKILSVDLWWVIGIPVLVYPFLLTKMKISKMEGFLLLGAYILYIVLLF